MSTQYQKLSGLLKQLFQSDQADLDFGIYRIINQRRDEINKSLDEYLLPKVETPENKMTPSIEDEIVTYHCAGERVI